MLDILRDNLLNYLAHQPLSGDDARIEDLSLLKSGWESEVYSFRLTHEEGGERVSQRLILKTYPNTAHGKDRALKERHALYNLRAVHYAVPGVALVEIDPTALGSPFIIMEYVEATPMSERLASAQPHQLPELARQFVGLMTGLHNLGYAVLVPRMKPVSEYALVTREIYTMRGLVEHYTLPEFTPLLDWLYEHRKDAPSATAVVTHRDFHPSNILLTESGLPFVIDWGWQISDPRYDLAWTLAQLRRDGHDAFADAVLAEYERVSEQPVAQLGYFTVLAITRWLMDQVVLARFTPLDLDARQGILEELIEPVRYAIYEISRETGIQLTAAERLLK